MVARKEKKWARMVCFWEKKSGNPGDSMKKVGLRRSEGGWDR